MSLTPSCRSSVADVFRLEAAVVQRFFCPTLRNPLEYSQKDASYAHLSEMCRMVEAVKNFLNPPQVLQHLVAMALWQS